MNKRLVCLLVMTMPFVIVLIGCKDYRTYDFAVRGHHAVLAGDVQKPFENIALSVDGCDVTSVNPVGVAYAVRGLPPMFQSFQFTVACPEGSANVMGGVDSSGNIINVNVTTS